MALFGRKKPPSDAEPPDGSSGDSSDFEPQPDKAKKWFDHARISCDSQNYEYALACFANGIRLDPELMPAHEAMLDAAMQYANQEGKPASSKEIKQIEGPHPVDRFAAAEFAWMKDLTNIKRALKFIEAAGKANDWVGHIARWHAPRIYNLLRKQKPSKSLFVQAKDLFVTIEAWKEALEIGGAAKQLDPSDNQLANELNDLAAQRAMEEGKYGDSFRGTIKDAQKQRELIEDESLSGAGSSEERKFERARLDYEQNPRSPEAVNLYAQLIKKKGTPESEEKAESVYLKGYEDTGEYRFRMNAGDIRIERSERRLRELEKQHASDNGELPDEVKEARDRVLALRRGEFEERVERYPTDRHLKARLGDTLFNMGEYEQAMAQFQAAKDEPKLRLRAGLMLGRCFAAEGWHGEAIEEFKEALNSQDSSSRDMELDIRYDLMKSQYQQAKETRSLDMANEALSNCSMITRKDITFRDIRTCRKEIDVLIKELSGISE